MRMDFSPEKETKKCAIFDKKTLTITASNTQKIVQIKANKQQNQ